MMKKLSKYINKRKVKNTIPLKRTKVQSSNFLSY